jgi:hypothetical protein
VIAKVMKRVAKLVDLLAVAPAYLVRDIPDNEEPFRDRKLEENKTSELNWRFRKVHDDKVDDQASVLCDEIIT